MTQIVVGYEEWAYHHYFDDDPERVPMRSELVVEVDAATLERWKTLEEQYTALQRDLGQLWDAEHKRHVGS